MEGARPVERRASRLVAWAAVALLPLVVVQPWLGEWSTLGFHDWDAMASHRELVRRSLVEHGELPFWNPYACGGFPAWGYIEGGTTLVSPWLAFYLLLPMSAAIRLEVLGSTWIGALGAYLAAGRLTRESAPRLLAVGLFAVNGRWGLQTAAGHAWHLAYALTPWCFWAFDRALRRRDVRSHGLLAALLAMLVYAGGIYPLPHTVLLLGIHAACLALLQRSARPILSLAASGLASMGLAAPKLLPMMRTFARAPRVIESVERYDAASLWAALVSRQQGFYDRPAPIRPYGWHEWGIYVGAVGLAALLLGLAVSVAMLRDRRATSLAIAGTALALLGLGAFAPWAPWPLLHAHAPFFGSMHVPSRFLQPALLALALAATPGLAALVVRARRGGRRAWLAPLLAAFAAGTGLDIALVARKPMTQAMWMRPAPGIVAGPFRHAQDPPFSYVRRDWAGPIYLAMLGNVGVLRCYGTPPFEPRGAVVATSEHGLVTLETDAGAAPIEVTDIVRWSPNGIEIAVRDAPPGATLVYDMNADPGWRATVIRDGGESEAPASSRHDRVAVAVPAGSSRVRFRYRAPGFAAGVAALVVTVGALGLLRLRERRRAA